jgi:hypothetical protein
MVLLLLGFFCMLSTNEGPNFFKTFNGFKVLCLVWMVGRIEVFRLASSSSRLKIFLKFFIQVCLKPNPFFCLKRGYDS